MALADTLKAMVGRTVKAAPQSIGEMAGSTWSGSVAQYDLTNPTHVRSAFVPRSQQVKREGAAYHSLIQGRIR